MATSRRVCLSTSSASANLLKKKCLFAALHSPLLRLRSRSGKERMRVIARNLLVAFARAHPETSVWLERWYRPSQGREWTSMDDIRHGAPRSKVLNRDVCASKSLVEITD